MCLSTFYPPGITNQNELSTIMNSTSHGRLQCNAKTKIIIFITISEYSEFALLMEASQNRTNINYFLKCTGIQQFLQHFCKAVSSTITYSASIDHNVPAHTYTYSDYYTITQVRCNRELHWCYVLLYHVENVYKKKKKKKGRSLNPLMIMKNCCITILWNQLLLFKG